MNNNEKELFSKFYLSNTYTKSIIFDEGKSAKKYVICFCDPEKQFILNKQLNNTFFTFFKNFFSEFLYGDHLGATFLKVEFSTFFKKCHNFFFINEMKKTL